MPAHEFAPASEGGGFLRGHFVVHIHYAGSDAAPDFDHVIHVNARFAVNVDAKHAKRNPCPRFGLSIDGEGVCLTGGVKADKMRRRPPWAWRHQDKQYPALVTESGAPIDRREFLPPYLPASSMHTLLFYMEEVRSDVRAHLLVPPEPAERAANDSWRGDGVSHR